MTNSEIKPTKVFIGIDIHTTNATVSFLNCETGETNYENDLEADEVSVCAYIKRMIKRHFSDGSYEFLAGYEAGYTGYKLYRYLTQHNINCVVIAPNTIKRSGKEKRVKNDLADARLIAKTLASNDYSAVEVPQDEDESTSHLLRYRDSIKKAINSLKNQLQALLTQKGFKTDHPKWSQPWLKDLAEFIQQEKLPRDKYVMQELMDDINHRTEKLQKTEALLEETSQEERYSESVKRLTSLKGISTLTALYLTVVAGDISRFESAESFSNYLGLCPGEQSSGKRQNNTGITKTGNPRMRSLLVLGAQTYSRGNPYYMSKQFLQNLEDADPDVAGYAIKAYRRLHKKYRHLRNDLHKSHNVCVTAVAKELACFAWRMLSGNIA